MGKETVVLVVEDDQAVLEAIRVLLEGHGRFRVLCAMGVREAQSCLEAGEGIDIVVADVILAGEITGIDVCRRARELHPGIALVIISADPGSEAELVPDGGVYLRKPFGGRELLAAMERARG